LAHVLAIEPDIRQAATLKRIVREKVFADVTVVDSLDAALEVINAGVPDVLLLSALLSPREEEDLIAHLRTLGGSQHVQTHTIPQLASTLDSDSKKGGARGLLSAFRRKKGSSTAPTGCDPDLFAEEVRTYLQSAEDKKRELETSGTTPPDIRPARVEPAAISASSANDPIGEPITAASSWDSPFEWKPSNPSALISQPYSRIAESESPTGEAAPMIADLDAPLAEPLITQSDSLLADPDTRVVHDEPVATYEESAAAYEPIAAREPEPEHLYSNSEPETSYAAATEPIVPNHQIDLDSYPELTVVDEPAHDIPEPTHAATRGTRAIAVETEIDLDSLPAEDDYEAQWTEPSAYTRPAIQDDDFGIGTFGLGPLATWARAKGTRSGDATPGDDLGMLLRALAVPTAVAGVRYPRGVRIRRVRVPASQGSERREQAGA